VTTDPGEMKFGRPAAIVAGICVAALLSMIFLNPG